jgi:DNA-binding transcriptional LysR family regulator
MAEGASKLSMSAMGQSEELEGTVTITASEANSAFLLTPIVKKIRNLAPGIKIEIVAKNDSADLRKREADIAVRNFQPKQPDLIMKQVSDSLGNFYATKEFIKKYGPFKTIKDLSKANFVSIGDLTSYIEGLKNFGINLSKENFPIITESHFVHWNLVKEGLAVGIMPHYIGDKDKSVERVLKSFKGISFSTWIVSHRELRTNRRIRFVFDQLVEYLNK